MHLIQENKKILAEVKRLILSLSEEQFVSPNKLFSGSSLGQHFRHLIEFYLAVQVGYKEGVICYDNRKRDLNIETKQDYAITVIAQIEHFLNAIKEDKSIVFEANYSVDDCKNSDQIKSSLYRELAYVLEHSIHHLAIVKIGFISLGLQVNENLGVAPSTVRNNKKVCVQ